jgi:PKD repeat protein
MRKLDTLRLLILFIALGGSVISANAQCINTYPYFENFDGANGQNGWTHAAYAGTLNTWAFGTPAKVNIIGSASAPNCFVTGGLSTGKYSNYEKSAVTSPCFDFSTMVNPEIKMDVWWESQFSQDGAVLQSSIDNGLTWQEVGAYNQSWNWFNDNSVNAGPGAQVGSSAIGWSGTFTPVSNGSNGWKTAQRVLTGLGGQPNVIFRIAFAADNAGNDDGFAFDNIMIKEQFNIDLGVNKTLCGGAPIVLSPGTFPGGTTFAWNAYNATTPTLTVSNPGTYIVTVTDPDGYKDKDTVIVTTSTLLLTLGPDTYVCPGNVLTLNSGNPQAPLHQWYNLSTGSLVGNAQTFNITQQGYYSALVSDGVGCVLRDTIFVFRDSLPNTDLGPDVSICVGNSIQLFAGIGGPNTTYLWSNGATSPTLNLSAPGTYSCTVTSWHGCQIADTVTLSLVPTPVVNLGPDHVECGQFVLNAGNAGSTYTWNTQATTQTITSATPGTYSVHVVNSVGCSANDTITIYPSTPFTVNLGADKVVCNGKPVILDPGNFGTGFTYFWSTAAVTQTINVTLPNIYYVTITNAQGCKRTDTANVTLSSLNVDLGPDKVLCNGASIVLVAGTSNNAYNWSTSSTTPTITVTTPNTYSVAVMDNLGCIISDTVVITAAGNFSSQIVAPSVGYLNAVVNFQDNPTPAASSTSWQWDFGDGVGTSTQQNPTYTYQSVGAFIVKLTAGNVGGCTYNSQKTITIEVAIAIDEAALGMNFTIVPNPNDGHFQFLADMENPEDVSFSIINMNGKSIFERQYSPQNNITDALSLEDLANGVYIIKVQKGDKTVFGKMMVNR